MTLPSEVRTAPAPSTNGDLVNRVQQLRLGEQLDASRRSGGSWLPWVLCGLLAITWAGVGVRWYKSAEAEKSGDVAAPGSNSPADRPGGGAGPATVAPGEIVFN